MRSVFKINLRPSELENRFNEIGKSVKTALLKNPESVKRSLVLFTNNKMEAPNTVQPTILRCAAYCGCTFPLGAKLKEDNYSK